MATKTTTEKRETGFFATLARGVRAILLVAELLMLSVYSIYIIYTMLAGSFLILKSILLLATVAYAIFYISQFESVGKPAKKRKKIGKRIYSLIKLAVKGGTLALTIYGIIAARTAPTFWSLMLTATMLLTWSISLFFEVLNYILSKILEGIKRRAAQKIAATKTKVTSIFKRRDKPAIEAPEAEIAQLPEAGGGEE